MPAREQDGYTVNDVKTALETSAVAIHEAVYIARQVWERDEDALNFDIDDLVQIESALQEICNLSSGIDCDEEDE